MLNWAEALRLSQRNRREGVTNICGALHGCAIGILLLLGANPARAETDLRAEAQTQFNLITDLVLVAPTELQREMIDRSWDVFDQWLRTPQEPPAEVRQRLAQTYGDFYARVRQQYPLVRVAWRADDLTRPETNAALQLTRGLESIVLIELTNRSPENLACVAAFAGPQRAFQVPVEILPGQSRTLWATLTVTNPAANNVTLNVSGGSGIAPRSLTLPIRVVEPAVIRGKLIEASTGEIFPGRVHVRGGDELLRRDHWHGTNETLSTKPLLNFVFGGLPKSYTLPFFYSTGEFEIQVPPGEARVTLERGYEHPLVATNVTLQPGEIREITLASKRFLDMKARGWVSGDTHIHWAKNSWDVNEDISLLAMAQRAEDVRVANNLTLKHHTTNANFIAPTQFPMGPIPGYCSEDWHMEMAEEYRNEEFYGHLIFLNIHRLIEPISTGFMGGTPFWDYPPNLPAILEARAQGGVSIEAHGLGNDADVPANVAHELADSLDQIEPEDYYRFLECGFQLPLSNGSDHPARVVGRARAYVKTKLPFTYANWIEGLRQNRTFTTSGPLLFLEVNGHDIGDVLDVKPDTKLTIKARGVSRFPLGTVQIVSNGKVIAEKKTQELETELTLEIPAGEPRWIAARCARGEKWNAIWADNVAHTAAIYVSVNGRARFNPVAAQEWIQRLRRHAENISRTGRFPTEENRAEAADYVLDAVRIYENLIEQHTAAAPVKIPAATKALIANVRAASTAIAESGRALHATDRNGLANLERYGGRGAREVMERILGRHTLVQVNINPEMRVKVNPGRAPAQLVAGEWQFFLARIENESGTTAPLQIKVVPPAHVPDSGVWLEAEVVPTGNVPATLSGAPLEYRLIKLRSRETGQREARLSLHVGQGTQDLGFRNEVDILFECRTNAPDNQPQNR